MAGTPATPLPADTGKVEPKVKVSAVAQYLAGLVLVALVSGLQDGNLISFLPDWVSTIVAPLIPSALAFLAAYNARHQYRAPETL